ncbi:heme-binding protein [Paenibacillus rhizophilus]
MMAATIEEVLQQERDMELDSFSAEDAFTLGMNVLEIAGKQSRGLVVSVRRNGKLLFYKAGTNTVIDQDDCIRQKTNVVNLHSHSSLYLFLKYDGDEQAYCQVNGVSSGDYALNGGCFPIKLRNAGMIGTVAVCGLTSEEEHMLCLNAISLLKRQQYKGEASSAK